MQTILLFHDEDGGPDLEKLIPANLRDKESKEGIRFGKGAAEVGSGETEESDIGLSTGSAKELEEWQKRFSAPRFLLMNLHPPNWSLR